MPLGKSRRTSRSTPQARAATPDQAQRLGSLRATRCRCPRSGPAPTASPTAASAAPSTSRSAGSQPLAQLLDARPRRRRTPRRPAAPVPRPKRLPQISGRHVQKIAAQPAADTTAVGKKADVAGQRAQIADVIGQPLQLQRDAAQRLGRAAASGSRPALRPPGNRPWHGRSSCRRRAFPCSGSCACSGPPTSARSTPRCW